MHGRHSHLNIPTEIVRTIVAISETGSLSKAAEKLGLSQPAVSSQIKRAEHILRGEIFLKTANGTAETQLGKLVLQQARRMLDANDQMLRLGGEAEGPQALRLGLGPLFVKKFFADQNTKSLAGSVVHTDTSDAIAKGLIEGHIDIACFYAISEMAPSVLDLVVNEALEPFAWVRSKDFVLRPGAPIPILVAPANDLLVRLLTRKGIAYKVVFSSPDYGARLDALHSGIGFAAVPTRMIPSSLALAKEYYLPELPPVRMLLCARMDLDTPVAANLLKTLQSLFFKSN